MKGKKNWLDFTEAVRNLCLTVNTDMPYDHLNFQRD